MGPFSQLEGTALDPLGDDVQKRSHALKHATLTVGCRELTNFLSYVKQLSLGGQFPELRKKLIGIMGAWRGFRMVLHAENWLGTVAQTLDGLVVEIDAVNFNLLRKCCGIHGKTVVLGGNLNAA